MGSVTTRVKLIKQPRGGYIPTSMFETIQLYDDFDVNEFDDSKKLKKINKLNELNKLNSLNEESNKKNKKNDFLYTLNQQENINAGIVGTVVEYLTRIMTGAANEDAFAISILGARNYCRIINDDIMDEILSIVESVEGVDALSIRIACMLASFDVWYRNPQNAIMGLNNFVRINDPNKETIENIRIMVLRGVSFFNKYGPAKLSGFNFMPYGYTSIIDAGDGDFLTEDTLIDFKTIKNKITSKHTLQILIYYLMGKHSKQKAFDNINKIAIFNPRLNIYYVLDINKVPNDIIEIVEKEVIGY